MLRRYTETRYGAKSWACERRVAARIEASTMGLDIRYVVTNLRCRQRRVALRHALLRARPGREPDQAAQDPACLGPHQLPLRLANQVRLVLHTAAYWLMLTVRDAIPKPQPLATRRVHDAAPATAQDRRAHHRDRHPRPHRLRRRLPEAELFRGIARSLQPAGP